MLIGQVTSVLMEKAFYYLNLKMKALCYTTLLQNAGHYLPRDISDDLGLHQHHRENWKPHSS